MGKTEHIKPHFVGLCGICIFALGPKHILKSRKKHFVGQAHIRYAAKHSAEHKRLLICYHEAKQHETPVMGEECKRFLERVGNKLASIMCLFAQHLIEMLQESFA